MENRHKSINWIYQKLSVAMHRGNAEANFKKPDR